ncbi:MAG TPA: (d)CMP kinase [Bryobacteraceae bacterium]|nr:(d)CMP kinase [Bryobacteraceae bacterium]
MPPKKIIVAIDGPAGAGKSTIARRLASRLGFLYIDTGAMYRAIGLWALRTQTALDDMHRLEQLALAANIELLEGGTRVKLNGEEITSLIRSQEMSDAASRVSAIPAVRRALVDKQRLMGAQQSAVMEGRDIGTNVFPDAGLKVYLDASVEVRAARRLRDLAAKGEVRTVEEVAREIRERDQRDSSRADAPLRQAPDAVLIDSSAMSLDEVEEAILKLYRDRTSNGKELES